jgi:hypothetical protein
MSPENPPRVHYWYGQYEGYELRCQRRLQNDLGVDQETAGTILHLRNQVLALQARIRELETELATHQSSQDVRLAGTREVAYEASWIEIEFVED